MSWGFFNKLCDVTRPTSGTENHSPTMVQVEHLTNADCRVKSLSGGEIFQLGGSKHYVTVQVFFRNIDIQVNDVISIDALTSYRVLNVGNYTELPGGFYRRADCEDN